MTLSSGRKLGRGVKKVENHWFRRSANSTPHSSRLCGLSITLELWYMQGMLAIRAPDCQLDAAVFKLVQF